MGWYPTFLAPLLAAVLLANLPMAPPFKVGLVLVIVQAAGAYGAYILTSLLHGTPAVLFCAIALILLLAFANLAHGRGFLPILLILISFSTVPIVTMMAPAQADALAFAFTRGMAIAVIAVWLAHALWPKVAPPAAPPGQAAPDSPFAKALTGVAIVLPLMLLYLMYGITDALPVLITTVVLVINFDPKRSAMQGMAMMVGNFIGGMCALLSYALLQIAPSLASLTLITFIIALLFAIRIERGGPASAVGVITFNQAIVLFSLSLAPGGSTPSLWVTRLVQFGIACIFAVGMMSLLFPRLKSLVR
jgi:Fusaric acid resistance protein-like